MYIKLDGVPGVARVYAEKVLYSSKISAALIVARRPLLRLARRTLLRPLLRLARRTLLRLVHTHTIALCRAKEYQVLCIYILAHFAQLLTEDDV